MTIECLALNIEAVYIIRFREQNKEQKKYHGHGPAKADMAQ